MGSGTFDSESEKEARTDLTHSRLPPAVRPLTVDAGHLHQQLGPNPPPRPAVTTPQPGR